MKQPGIYHVDYLANYDENTKLNGRWCKARPKHQKGLFKRLKITLLVFVGKADAVIWTDQ